MCESNPLLRFAEFGNRFVFNDGKCDLKSNIQKSYIYIYIYNNNNIVSII